MSYRPPVEHERAIDAGRFNDVLGFGQRGERLRELNGLERAATAGQRQEFVGGLFDLGLLFLGQGLLQRGGCGRRVRLQFADSRRLLQLRLLINALRHRYVGIMGERDDARVAGTYPHLFLRARGLWIGYRLVPLREYVRRVDGGGEHNALDVRGERDERFFPVLAALRVVDVMHLVEDHRGQFVHRDLEAEFLRRRLWLLALGIGRRGLWVKKQIVHKDFGGHQEDLRGGVGLDVARQQAERYVRVFLRKLVVFLVGERLDGAGVYDLLAATGPVFDGKLGGQCFARAGVGSYEHVLVL